MAASNISSSKQPFVDTKTAECSSGMTLTCGIVTKSKGRPCTNTAHIRREDGEFVCGVHKRAPIECSICLTEIRQSRKKLQCGHHFHATCIRRWFRRGTISCPLCRAPCVQDLDLNGLTVGGRLRSFLRMVPCPPTTYFSAYMLALLSAPDIQTLLHVSESDRQLLMDVSYISFNEDHFLWYLLQLRL
jgi:hypothetical protein